jgi:hypothetical protein
MAAIGALLLILGVGFAGGYAARELISRRRRADARRSRTIL